MRSAQSVSPSINLCPRYASTLKSLHPSRCTIPPLGSHVCHTLAVTTPSAHRLHASRRRIRSQRRRRRTHRLDVGGRD